ncbi:MAG: protein translocase subunit SecF [Bacteroidetes bacterium]|jgi:preprotein translocase SecF subunit|nr:protein translocase subunit SecF [Bacteroidota bacterium]
MRLFENADYNLVGARTKGYIFSGVLLVLSFISFALHGLEMGIDFQGGMEFVVQSETDLQPTEVRSILGQALGEEPEVKTFEDDLLIRTLPEGEITVVENQILEAIAAAYPGANPDIIKTDIVGPRFASDLKRGAVYAVLGSLLVIFIYILIRFEWRFSLGAVGAVFHDVLIVLGLFSMLHGFLPFSLQIDQAIIAAFLTIVGYSLNDTVVIFDRIREYTNIFKTEPYEDVVNKSVNTTLSRTVVTSLTTLLVVTILFIFGGDVLRGFSFALIVGILIGTYSSVFVATPIVVELQARAAS